LFCCPTCKVLSLSNLLLFSIWVLYIICCILGIDTSKNASGVLAILPTVMLDFGAMFGPYIKSGEVYRIITAAFLHWNLLHIFSNSIFIIFFMTRLEHIYPFYITLVLIIGSAISGSITSIVANYYAISAGASTICFGVLGGYIAYMTINWVYLGRLGQMRSMLCCFVAIAVIFSIVSSFTGQVDWAGHLGGLAGGLFLSLGMFPGLGEKSKVFTIAGYGLFVIYLVTMFLVFFLTDQTK